MVKSYKKKPIYYVKVKFTYFNVKLVFATINLSKSVVKNRYESSTVTQTRPKNIETRTVKNFGQNLFHFRQSKQFFIHIPSNSPRRRISP